MITVLFACVHNAGRSQMAAALFNDLASPELGRAVSAGTAPGDAVHPQVVLAMREAGIDLSAAAPRRLTPGLLHGVNVLVTMGCGEQCPVVPGARTEEWPVADPKGQPLETVRAIRDEIRRRVADLVAREHVGRASPAESPLAD
ncbi:MAG TPA: arsenate reductase ArsC [Vicinamibacterales bacterium]|nr:arsenate reductase ArsC [Vicinamibacterales bacterium]